MRICVLRSVIGPLRKRYPPPPDALEALKLMFAGDVKIITRQTPKISFLNNPIMLKYLICE